MTTYTSYTQSPLGQLKIQCTDEKVTAVLFWEAEAGRPDEHPLLDSCKQQMDDYFSGKRQIFSLPLQQEGTAFQQKVWELLCRIPFGATISYQQLADQYGDRKAIRAVASANGRNNLAIIVPCHRVIGSNQSLTGYAGGLWRKKWLLEHEARYHSGVQQLGMGF
ncbi:methylated-DNA--[protein]-cysteine S-methyltransferase [Flavisolibacter nicotianae]|uniref:methylated-DNA--[protein]-cysteine S-methyltransferase n=1 Tax=Flavisolibacter nicotianae TaxID=2364882 RepID=UPI000EB30A95|nr:methylated-DNA--[protein]-cysteine S-methyltransferase [Flavisolibacter nicotianae]